MKVSELFYSLQGEGRHTGQPTIFIRTTGCNLRCTYCDTTYAYEDGIAMTPDEILQAIAKYPCRTCCVTGGEPLLQPDIDTLLKALINNHYHVSIETNGSRPITPYTKTDAIMISLDVKCPSSTMQDHMELSNLKHLRPLDQVKFIIGDRVDYDYANDILHRYPTKAVVFFQPVWGTDSTKLAGWILEDGLGVQLGIQLHKFLWGTQRKK
jgi:7-carboxy-7-deazaguanine synthase